MYSLGDRPRPGANSVGYTPLSMAKENQIDPIRRLAAIACFSSAVLLTEITLTRIFSVVLMYHYAYLVLSIALFGLGAGGIFHFATDVLRRRAEWLALLPMIAGIGLIVSLGTILRIPFSPQLLTPGNLGNLVAIILVTAVPFFLAGLFISYLLMACRDEIPQLYAFDLLGAAAGCLSAVLLLGLIGAMGTPFVAALLFGITGLLIPLAAPSQRKNALAAALLAVVTLGWSGGLLQLEFVKGRDEIVEFERWNAFSRVAVTDIDGRKAIHIDADASTEILPSSLARAGGATLLDTATGLVYRLRSGADVLIIGPGGGRDVVAAMAADNDITAVEINPIITGEVMTERYLDYSGAIYDDPSVEIVTADARSYLERSSELFDVIQANAVDTWAAASGGGFTLSESYLYTVEAFESYFRHLKEDGILQIGRWAFSQPQQLARIVSVAVEALERLGSSDLSGQFFIISDPSYEQGGGTPGVVFIRKTPFGASELELLRRSAGDQGFEILHDPGTPRTNVYSELLHAPDRERFFDEYPLNIRPTTDDRPFFFLTLKWRDVLSVWNTPEESRKNNSGLFLILVVFVVMLVATTICFILPLVLTGRCRIRTAPGAFFLNIGLAFMMVEAVLIQRSSLFLGHPSISFLTVLCALLLGAGSGSWLTSRTAPEAAMTDLRRSLIRAALTLLIVSVALPVWELAGFQWTIGYRVVWLGLPIFLSGLVLGRLFPLGLRLCDEAEIAWAWALNGSASVLGSIAAILIAMVAGFSWVLWIAAALYATAALTSRWWVPTGSSP